MPDERGRRRTMVGTVTSDKMDKTVVVAVDSVRRHRLYGRSIRTTHKFKAHDPLNKIKIGDIVEISESRPLSKEKHWVVSRLVKSGQEVIALVDVPEATGRSA